MKPKPYAIDLDRYAGTEVRIDLLPAYFPKLPKERVIRDGVRAVFEGRLLPGKTPGRYLIPAKR